MKQNRQSKREMTVLLILLSSDKHLGQQRYPTQVPPAAWGCGGFASYKNCFQSASTLG